MNGKSARRWLAETVIAVTIVLLGTAGSGRTANPDALWRIVHDKCVPDQEQNGDPAPCALVDLREGDPRVGHETLIYLKLTTKQQSIFEPRSSGSLSSTIGSALRPKIIEESSESRSVQPSDAGFDAVGPSSPINGSAEDFTGSRAFLVRARRAVIEIQAAPEGL